MQIEVTIPQDDGPAFLIGHKLIWDRATDAVEIHTLNRHGRAYSISSANREEFLSALRGIGIL